MIKKIGGFLEEHVEKIILIIVGLLCSWLLITRVLLTPNVVEYDGKNFSPGYLDVQILEDVKEKIKKNESELFDIIPPDKRNYSLLFENPLEDTDFIALSKPVKPKKDPNTSYPEPDINKIKVTNAAVEYIRSVVYEPIEEITKSKPYQNGNSEPNDLDFITVSGNIDIKSIVDEFNKCYNNGEMADPCKAKPIFAQVNLQRQRLISDGQWSDWENVPRTQIDYNRKLFKVVENFSDLPLGGLEVYKFQLNHTITQLELLQPEPYQIASANEEWLPPELHKDFVEALKKDSKKEEATNSTTSSDTRRKRGGNTLNTGGVGSTSTNSGSRGGGSRRSGNSANYNTNANTTRRNRGSTTNETTTNNTTTQDELYVDQVYDVYESIILTNTTDFKKISEPILFWAHDDTAQPDNTYRYRVRVGLLNPTAQNENDEIIFWSSFSDVTDEVDIPGKIYFFAGEVQEAAKTVSVSVYKLHLGYWYKKVYDRVAQGEMIGGLAEVEPKESDDTLTSDSISDFDEMETIDFTTGAVMVDVVRVSEWAGSSSMNPVPYHNMMYTYDGEEILQMPATARPNLQIWPSELYHAYNFVQSHLNDKYEALKSWGNSTVDIEQARSGQQNNRRTRR